MSNPESDPTRVRAQQALQTGRRRRWLIPGGLFAAVALALFLAAFSLQVVVPLIGVGLVIALYGAMVTVAITVADPRSRNRTMAWLMGTMAVGSLVLAVVLWALEWSALL